MLPPALSTFAPEVDRIFGFVHWLALLVVAGVVGAMVVLLRRHQRGRDMPAEPPEDPRATRWLQLVWIVAPLVPYALLFHWGFQAYLEQTIAPDDAYTVRVRARQWAWEFEHPNGITEDNELHVPAGRAVRLVLSSSDVIHSFYAPELRVKRDAVPGMFTSLWFEAIERPDVALEGDLAFPDPRRVWYRTPVHCAELCGASGRWDANAGHATMRAEILVMRPEDFEDWSIGGCRLPLPESELEWGEILFSQKGCTACHAREPDAPALAGPNLHGLFERAAEDYVRESIRNPRAHVVSGHQPVMPRIRFSEPQLDALVVYLRTL